MLNMMLVFSLTMVAIEVAALVAAGAATVALAVAQEATMVPTKHKKLELQMYSM